MNGMTVRKYFFDEAEVDNNRELDLLTNRLPPMKLSTMEFYRVDNATAYRPDLISLKYYGNYDLGWLICEQNDILDPLTEFYPGRVVKIPSITEYYQYYNRNTRGV